MTLAAPKLDDRRFQDLVDEAKKRIPHYCKDWTDHNVSDPGITLIELFAWMTELLLYRLNQVPDLHYIKFLEMLGVKLHPAIPAKAPITFWLSAPQDVPVTIPAGTEVASTQTETERSVVFTSDSDLQINPPQLSAVIPTTGSAGKGQKRRSEINLRNLAAGFEGVDVFSKTPHVDDALCIGFDNDMSYHLLGFDLEFDSTEGAGIDPTQPPYVWEASTGDQVQPWAPCDLELDTTLGMNSAGVVQIHVPKMGPVKLGAHNLFWVRVRVKDISSQEKKRGMRGYSKSPVLRSLSVASWGGTVPATNSQQVKEEFLGRSDGSAGQRFQLQVAPLLQRRSDETLVVKVDGEPAQEWKEVPDFAETGSGDPCFTLDSGTGELRFGPAVRQPDGTMKLYGTIPARGATLVFKAYRFGGGEQGNVLAGFLNTLKTSIPYVSKVLNRQPASGGLDAETLEAAMLRAPAMLRARDRAVTEADYEFLARQASSAIGRVKCLQPLAEEGGRIIPGQIYVLVIPRPQNPERFLEPAQLEIKPEILNDLRLYLDERRMLTTRLDIRPPAYRWVTVKVRLRADLSLERAVVEQSVLARLYSFLNPLVGGPEKNGWPFGRELFISDVYQCLQGLPGVQFVRSVEMFEAHPGGTSIGDALQALDVAPHGVIASARHKVEFI